MATDIDFQKLEKDASKSVNGDVGMTGKAPRYDPVRRKLFFD